MNVAGAAAAPHRLRGLRVGDQVPTALLGPMRVRRLDATALILPGRADLAGYLADLGPAQAEFASWDGRMTIAEPDGEVAHRLLVVDRFRQVYAVYDEADANALPDAHELSEWFRFLATACPECGVIDDPLLSGPTP
jgi:hypothetical protein